MGVARLWAQISASYRAVVPNLSALVWYEMWENLLLRQHIANVLTTIYYFSHSDDIEQH